MKFACEMQNLLYLSLAVPVTVTKDLFTAQPSFKESHKKCTPYTGSVCSNNMNSERLVHVARNMTQEQTEKKLRKYYRHIQSDVNIGCREVILRTLCLYFYEPCNLEKDGSAFYTKICKDECVKFRKSPCAKLMGFHIAGFNHGPDNFLRKECMNHPTYGNTYDNEDCAHLRVPYDIEEEGCRNYQLYQKGKSLYV